MGIPGKNDPMKKQLLKVWRRLPFFLQALASFIIRPHYLVAVGALVINEKGQLLLCKHSYRRNHPWGLPGGDLKFKEDPTEAIKRELLEETGLTAQSVRLLLVRSSTRLRHLDLVYLCTGISGSFLPNDEVVSTAYFDFDHLPQFYPDEKITIDQALKMLPGKQIK